jgi:hypothetical protein
MTASAYSTARHHFFFVVARSSVKTLKAMANSARQIKTCRLEQRMSATPSNAEKYRARPRADADARFPPPGTGFLPPETEAPKAP